jgi:hypothetical protein
MRTCLCYLAMMTFGKYVNADHQANIVASVIVILGGVVAILQDVAELHARFREIRKDDK